MARRTQDEAGELSPERLSVSRDGTGMDNAVGRGGEAAVSLRNLGTFNSFQNPVFRIYFTSLLCQWGAMNTQLLVRSLLIYRITGSAAIMGLMALANSVPMLLFSFFGGVMADRLRKKWMIFVGDLCFATVSLAVAIALVTGVLSPEQPDSWWVLLVYSLASGTIMGLMTPARSALVAEIVGQSQLMNGVALTTFGQNTARLVMPGLGGFLVEAFDFATTYFLMTALYILAATFIWFLPITGRVFSRGRSALGDLKDGLAYVRGEPIILLILAFSLFAVLFSMPYMTLLPIFTEDILKVGAGGLGILLSVSGAGTVVGSLVLASLPSKRRGAMLLVGSLLLGLALVGFSSSNLWPLSLAMMVFVGLGQSARMTLSNTLLQHYTVDQYRGRVMSLYMMEFGLSSFGTFFAGIMALTIGIQWSVGGLAVLLIIMCILLLAFLPKLRRLD